MKRTILIVSLLASSLSYSQVIYSDVNPDLVLTAASPAVGANIDLNNDGTEDIQIQAAEIEHPTYGTFNTSATVMLSETGAIQADPVQTTYETKALADAYFVDPTATNWVDTATGIGINNLFAVDLNMAVSGQFDAAAGDKYIGVRFPVGAETFYGWVLINVTDNAATTTIKEYAYNSTAGQGLYTGHTNGLQNIVYSNWTAGVNGQSIVIGSSVDGEYTVTDASGRVVATGEVVNGKATAEVGQSGIFVVSFSGDAGFGTKKVVLN